MVSTQKTQPKADKPADEKYLPGDPIPVAEAIEMDSDSAWAMWQDSTQEPKPTFAETIPMPLEDMPPPRKP